MKIKKLKGFGISELGDAILAMVFIVGIALLILGLTGGFERFGGWFSCEDPKGKFWCEEKEVTDYKIAEASTKALQCAINSVMLGSEWNNCLDNSGGVTAAVTDSENLITEEQRIRCTYEQGCQQDCRNICNAKGICKSSKISDCREPIGQLQTQSDCKCTMTYRKTEGAYVACENDYSKCEVRNFQLPQDVSKAEEWIPDYGDPKFLVYWQSFPMDQDTWSFKSDWKTHVIIGLITFFPPLKTGKLIAESKILYGLATRFPTIERFALRYGGESAVLDIATRTGAKNVMKGALAHIFASRFKRPVRTLLKGVTLKGAVWAAQLADSVTWKLDPTNAPNKIVLKVALEKEGEKYNLADEIKGKPVLIQFRPGVFKQEEVAHLVSPCKIASLPVVKAATECDAYSFNLENGVVSCAGPNFESKVESGDFSCVSENNPISNVDFKGKTIDNVKNKFENSPDVREVTTGDTDEDGKMDRLYLEYQQGKYTIADSDYNGYFDTYAMESCKIEAVFIKYKEANGIDGYCVNEEGILKTVLEGTATYGGYAAMAVGGVALLFIPGAQIAIPGVVSVGAGTLLSIGTLAVSASEISESVGGWPD